MSAHRKEIVEWDRRRVLLVLGMALAGGVALLVGLVCAVYFAVASAKSDGRANTATQRHADAGVTGRADRDAIAAAPMLNVDANAARPAPPAAVPAPMITVPGSTTLGPAGVPSGFPHTPGGAIGQLAAIEQVVLQSMSVQVANIIHANWAMPAARGVAQWPLTQNVQSFLGGARMGSTMDPTSTVVVTLAGAQIKGVDGPDWVLACVLVKVRATITQDAQMGYGYCERMQWHSSRWMIAPGAVPAAAPSTWPGGALSNKAGWRTWAGGGAD